MMETKNAINAINAFQPRLFPTARAIVCHYFPKLEAFPRRHRVEQMIELAVSLSGEQVVFLWVLGSCMSKRPTKDLIADIFATTSFLHAKDLHEFVPRKLSEVVFKLLY